MMRSILLTLILAATSVACRADGEVARIDGFVVKHADIACPAGVSREVCAVIRQENFDRLAQPLLVDAAAKIHRVSITDAELSQLTVKVPDAQLRAADERMKRLARAALLVRRGEDVDAVYQRDLAPHGVTKEQFRGVMTAYPDEAAVLRALSVDVGRETRRQFNQQARRRLAEQKLGRVVDEQSKQSDVAFEVAAQRFWAAVVNRSDSVVRRIPSPARDGRSFETMIRLSSMAVLAMFVVHVAFGQQKINVNTDVKENAAAQLRYAQALANEVGRARTVDERRSAIARASSAFATVRKHWRNDADAYLRSVLMESDLFLNGNAPENAVKLLEPLEGRLVGNPNEAALLRRLGTAYAMVEQSDKAEKAFKKALHSKAVDKNAEQNFLTRRAAAQFYSRTARHREAAALYRDVMRNRGVSDTVRADAALDSLREMLHANDKASAGANLPEIVAIVKHATKAASPDTKRFMERELARLTEKSR